MMLETYKNLIFFEQKNFLYYEPVDIIFAEGEKDELMYGILYGEVEIWSNGEVLGVITSSDLFGIGAVVYKAHLRRYTAIAKTFCKLVSMDLQQLLSVIQITPLFGLEVMRSYSERFQRLEHHI